MIFCHCDRMMHRIHQNDRRVRTNKFFHSVIRAQRNTVCIVNRLSMSNNFYRSHPHLLRSGHCCWLNLSDLCKCHSHCCIVLLSEGDGRPGSRYQVNTGTQCGTVCNTGGVTGTQHGPAWSKEHLGQHGMLHR